MRAHSCILAYRVHIRAFFEVEEEVLWPYFMYIFFFLIITSIYIYIYIGRVIDIYQIYGLLIMAWKIILAFTFYL